MIYRAILEHVDEHQGRLYLAECEGFTRAIDLIKASKASDAIGDPYRFTYGSVGPVSPSTLRYVKVAADLESLFGSISGLRVAEIGIGYAGQCRVVCDAWEVGRYYLYDIPEVLSLAHRFVQASGFEDQPIRLCDGRDPEGGEFDLIISNYAFSELRRELQEVYLDRILSRSARGYITYNHISPPEWGSLTAGEFAARIPGAEIVPETPLTFPGNVVVVWGHRTLA